ncbi:MAG: ExeM/NucH family extracellular endonuclease [Opitutus sp.]
MRFIPRLFLHVTVALGLIPATFAQTPSTISYTGSPYTQNFDTLASVGTFTLSGAGPFALDEAPFATSSGGPSPLAGWRFAKVSGTGANALFFVGTGSSTTGGVYSFGATDSLADRAFGTLLSGTVGSTVGAVFTNDTGVTITEFTLSYTGEQWRYGGTTGTDRLSFEYQVGASSIVGGTFTSAPALDFTSVIHGDGSTGSAAQSGIGNTSKSTLTSTVTGLNWAPGQTLAIRWSDFNVTGSDDGLAIDDLTFSTSSAPVQLAVSSTLPSANAVNVAPGASITVNFNSPVNVSGTWFTLAGSISGPHTAGVSGGATQFTLSPSPVFTDGETVTLTILKDQVADASTGLIHPAADYITTFTIFSSTPIPVHTVQGAGTTSPYAGQIISVEGIVTADFQVTGSLGGFYVQALEAEYDADATTSEGMFIFNTTFAVNVGDRVRVTGSVAEFGTAPRTQTELTAVTNVTILSTGNGLPAPTPVNLPFASTTYGERYEGMLVTLPQTLTVTDTFDLGRFGEIVLSLGRLSNPTNIVAPGAAAIAQAATNLLSQILVDDGAAPQNPDPTPFLADSAGLGLTRRTGSTTSNVTGIFDEKFGSYIIEPTTTLTFVDANPRTTPPAVQGGLRIAIGNVLNLFNGDGNGGGFPTTRGADTPVEYQRQLAKIVAGIAAIRPDVMGLTELENDGFGSTSAIAQLVSSLNAAVPVGYTYAFVNTAGIDLTSDEIHNGLIYRTETVEIVGAPAALNGTYFVGIARSPVAQTFRQISTGEVLTVSINHFKSKGSASTGPAATDGIVPNPNVDTGDGQGNSNYVRTKQAQTLAAWLATDPTKSGDPDFLIIGDLNAYAKEDPIVALEHAGYINLTEAVEGVGGYSYSFNGEFGHLDHALASAHLAEQFVDAGTWHANSDEPPYYDYNTEFKSAAQQAINVGTPYRYSDHDPVIVGFDLHPDPSAPAITTSPQDLTVDEGSSATFSVVASGYPAPTYQWFFNGNPIASATSASFTIAATSFADAGNYSVVATNDRGSVSSGSAVLTVRDITPPILMLPANLQLEATSPAGAVATFTVSATDNRDGVIAATATPPSGSTFPIGTTTVNVKATDAANNSISGSFTVTVSDTLAPTLSLSVTPNVLRPPNHKMVKVTVTANVTDAGDPAPATKIIAISSNEPVTGPGTGNKSPDWQITGALTADLRAERSGAGTGRVYTITVESLDASGNVTQAKVTVTVPQ